MLIWLQCLFYFSCFYVLRPWVFAVFIPAPQKITCYVLKKNERKSYIEFLWYFKDDSKDFCLMEKRANSRAVSGLALLCDSDVTCPSAYGHPFQSHDHMLRPLLFSPIHSEHTFVIMITPILFLNFNIRLLRLLETAWMLDFLLHL